MTNFLPAAVAALTLLSMPMVAGAEPGNGRPFAQGENGAFCPPGLARRDPACVPPGQARHALSESERAQRREERRAERGEIDAERIAQARAERRAEREAAERLAQAEAEREARDRAVARAEVERADDPSPAERILAALLAPQAQAAASSSSTALPGLPVQQPSVVSPSLAPGQPVSLTEALALAAASGATGF